MHYIDMKLTSPKTKNPSAPTLVLSTKAFKKIYFWTKMAAQRNLEVSGMGRIVRVGNELRVIDAYLVKPLRAESAYVEMDPAAVAELMSDLVMAGKSLKQLRFQWHSHVHMAVGWSRTDDVNSRSEFCVNSDWTVSLVTNAYGHFLARQDFPKTQQLPIHNLPVVARQKIESVDESAWTKEYAEKHENVRISSAQWGNSSSYADLYKPNEPKETPKQWQPTPTQPRYPVPTDFSDRSMLPILRNS